MIKAPWMNIQYHAFTIAKFGNRADENEDAYWPPWNDKYLKRRRTFRCAVADGATQTSFSSLWAKLLVDNTGGASARKVRNAIASAQRQWFTDIVQRQLPWHAEIKVKQGAYATLLWFELYLDRDQSKGIWKSIAIGDSCLFQIRKGELIRAYPVENPEVFDNHPVLLSSHQSKNKVVWDSPYSNAVHGNWEDGDQFYLMTDALAMWFLNEVVAGRYVPSFLQDVGLDMIFPQRQFELLVEHLRGTHNLRNDDTTLIWIQTNLNGLK